MTILGWRRPGKITQRLHLKQQRKLLLFCFNYFSCELEVKLGVRGSVCTGMLFVVISTGGFAMQYIHLPSGLRQYRTIKAAAIWPRQVKFAKAANYNIKLSISSVRISLVAEDDSPIAPQPECHHRSNLKSAFPLV